MHHPARIQPQISPWLEIYPAHGVIKIFDAFLDDRHFVLDTAE
ncbi:hypothetical protein LMG26411_08170 [Cupriavidus numazuensis]|uniref:MBL fold metallo-hydrolase n=1 Tax=Cupriavidus numazuensis TaxID=221992 RepID=A0ABN7QCK3_9BURK|nr:hypothetical protein LMG26411_08170 [Cupriavidus numazuensis]